MNDFARRLLDWWTRHGRHDLPWQHPREPYRVWVAEIMLQQTRVSTVIPYFERFMARFPTLPDLAVAGVDDVLAYWSGLGYYARARNLHRAARVIADEYDGEFPRDRETLETLPGLGRSTAAAVAAQAFDLPEPILDGNAKRVIARHAGIEGWPGEHAVERALWREAGSRMPRERAADYTQAVMDLGSTVCLRRKPRCGECPVRLDCSAFTTARTDGIPAPRPRRDRPRRTACMALVRDCDDRILLVRRAPAGIWGGLWSLPQADSVMELKRMLPEAGGWEPAGGFEHGFTHFILCAELHATRLDGPAPVRDADRYWATPADLPGLALPAPIRTLLENL